MRILRYCDHPEPYFGMCYGSRMTFLRRAVPLQQRSASSRGCDVTWLQHLSGSILDFHHNKAGMQVVRHGASALRRDVGQLTRVEAPAPFIYSSWRVNALRFTDCPPDRQRQTYEYRCGACGAVRRRRLTGFEELAVDPCQWSASTALYDRPFGILHWEQLQVMRGEYMCDSSCFLPRQ